MKPGIEESLVKSLKTFKEDALNGKAVADSIHMVNGMWTVDGEEVKEASFIEQLTYDALLQLLEEISTHEADSKND